MTPEDLASASRLIDLLKAKGARSFKGFGIELELAPAEPTAQKLPDAAPENLCACGHDRDTEHLNGLCIKAGCDPTTCAQGLK